MHGTVHSLSEWLDDQPAQIRTCPQVWAFGKCSISRVTLCVVGLPPASFWHDLRLVICSSRELREQDPLGLCSHKTHREGCHEKGSERMEVRQGEFWKRRSIV